MNNTEYKSSKGGHILNFQKLRESNKLNVFEIHRTTPHSTIPRG